MNNKILFVSFNCDNDSRFNYLLNAWSNNDDFEFEFDDKSTKEINSWNISTIKGVLTKKIKEADYTIVIIGSEANKKHKDSELIGYKNWQNFEIAKSKDNGNKIIAIKIDKSFESPEELLGSGASWAYSFETEAIMKAVKSV